MNAGGQETLDQFLESTDPDVTLMRRVRDDDGAAFEELVCRYQDRLIRLLANLIGDGQEAEDLAREVFTRIHRARKGYRPRERFATWLFRLAASLAIQRLRAKGREPMATAPSRPANLGAAVREAIAALDDDQRLAVLLSKFEEMRYSEIAAVMNRSEATVKSLLSQARLRLRDRLEPYIQAGPRG